MKAAAKPIRTGAREKATAGIVLGEKDKEKEKNKRPETIETPVSTEKTEGSKNVSARSVHSSVQKMAITAMCIALTYVATAFINIRLPIQANGGLIHLGNAALFISAVLFGKKTGALAGGLGMALFDLMGGWVSWAPFTLVIVGLMGFETGLITEKKKSPVRIIVAMVLALVIKIGGYYIAEGILYGNWIAPLTSIPGNIIQVVAGSIIAFPIIGILKKVLKLSK